MHQLYRQHPHHIDSIFAETSDRFTHISAPIQPSTNQSTNDTVHTPQIPPYTLHKYHNHTASTNTYSLHKHSTNTHTRRRARPDVDAVDALDVDTTLHRRSARLQVGLTVRHFRPDTHSQHRCQSQPRCTRSHAPVRNSTGQADRIRPRTDQTRPDQDQATQFIQLNRPGNQTGRVQNQTEPDQAMTCSRFDRPGTRQAMT